MADVIYHAYDMKGSKEEFANWISEISPTETPFTALAKKGKVQEVMFEWQTDIDEIPSAANAHKQGSDAVSVALIPTEVKFNYVQIFRKVVTVSDTAEAIETYGKGNEIDYQLKKAHRELNRDIEATMLTSQEKQAGTSTDPYLTDALGAHSFDFLEVNSTKAEFKDKLFSVLLSLYTFGAESSVIMYHPSVANLVSKLQERNGLSKRIFKNDKNYETEVNYIRDPLGQDLYCIVNRFCPEDTIYIIDPKQISFQTLRGPETVELGKTGSSTTYMIEHEVGLRVDSGASIGKITITD